MNVPQEKSQASVWVGNALCVIGQNELFFPYHSLIRAFLHFFPGGFPYFAEIVNDFSTGKMREILSYHGKTYVKHLTSKETVSWRCPCHYSRNCRARITSRKIDGCVRVNKPDTAIIHTDHTAKKRTKTSKSIFTIDQYNETGQ